MSVLRSATSPELFSFLFFSMGFVVVVVVVIIVVAVVFLGGR